ncbi:hypothetical protein LTR86_000806 [Recurvomyces mirabilis]|nr:hypothetical protein LTR86_000806 [Recurvomyces mirabilis]
MLEVYRAVLEKHGLSKKTVFSKDTYNGDRDSFTTLYLTLEKHEFTFWKDLIQAMQEFFDDMYDIDFSPA